MWLVLTLILGASREIGAPSMSIQEQYAPGEFLFLEDGETFVARYRLKSPSEVGKGVKYPLIVWLHGFGEQGADNREHLRWLNLIAATAPHDHYYAMALQCPDGVPWYEIAGEVRPGDMLTVANTVVTELVESLPIDRDRIYLTGVSSGGCACWEMAMRYPDRFAAIAPLSCTGGNSSLLRRITHVPCWAFHSATDSPQAAQATVDRLNEIGGIAHLTLVENDKLDLKLMHTPHVLLDHDSWTGACEHYRLMEWLLSQRRGTVSVPPGVRPGSFFNYGGSVVVLVVGILVCSRAIMRRKPSVSSIK